MLKRKKNPFIAICEQNLKQTFNAQMKTIQEKF